MLRPKRWFSSLLAVVRSFILIPDEKRVSGGRPPGEERPWQRNSTRRQVHFAPLRDAGGHCRGTVAPGKLFHGGGLRQHSRLPALAGSEMGAQRRYKQFDRSAGKGTVACG